MLDFRQGYVSFIHVSFHFIILASYGRSVEAPIPAYIYSFSIDIAEQNHKFVVSYKINEGNDTIFIKILVE